MNWMMKFGNVSRASNIFFWLKIELLLLNIKEVKGAEGKEEKRQKTVVKLLRENYKVQSPFRT